MPFRPKKILVATDFSDCARVAVDAAVDLARQFQAELTLVHVIPVSAYVDLASSMSGQIAGNIGYAEAVRAVAETRWSEERERLSKAGVPLSFVTREGSPVLDIADTAKTGAFDLVVVGTHGRTGLRHILLGSVAEGVVRHCSVPVLTLRGP